MNKITLFDIKTKVLSFFIPGRRRKEKYFLRREEKKKREFFTEFARKNPLFQHISKFSARNSVKSVLIIELNSFHGITLPGYIEYWSELGYNVDLLLDYNHFYEKALERVRRNYRVFVGDRDCLVKFIRDGNCFYYSFVFINTTFVWPQPAQNIKDLVGFMPSGRHGFAIIEHNLTPYLELFNESQYIESGNLFTLLGFKNTEMLFPDCIGEVKVTPKSRQVCKFICVGTIYAGNKNFNELFDVVRILVAKGITNFEIIHIGHGHLFIPEDIKNYFRFLGPLNYDVMYKWMERADFYLPLLDSCTAEHKKYLDSWVTGSSIQIFGFLKPAVINRFFANAYHFNDENALLYEGNTYADCMQRAIEMSPTEYTEIVQQLLLTRERLHSNSLENLKAFISKYDGTY